MSLKITFNISKLPTKLKDAIYNARMESSGYQPVSGEYTEVYRRLPFRLHLAYGMGHVLNDVCASMWFTYLLVFFHLVLEFSNWQTGFMLLVGQVADAVATPFVGYHSDQSDTFWFCRYGRRKVWHLVGTVCVLIAFPFIFAPCIACEHSHRWAQMFYYCIFIIIFQFGWAAVQISHLSLIPELTPNEHDRTKLTAVRYCFTVISNVLVYVVTWIVLHLNDGENKKISPNDVYKFQHVVYSVLSIGIICSAIFHMYVKEPGNNGSNDVRGEVQRFTVREILTNFKVYYVAVVYMSSRLFVNLSQVFVPLYLHETLNMAASSLALVPLTMFIGSFITSLCVDKITWCVGSKVTYLIGAALAVVACMFIRYGDGEQYTKTSIYAVAYLVGAAGSVQLVTSLGLTTDLIGVKTGSGAFVYGIMSFTDKMANGIAVVIIQDLHKDPTNSLYYRNVLTYVCGGAALMGAMAVIYLLTKFRRGSYDVNRVHNYDTIN